MCYAGCLELRHDVVELGGVDVRHLLVLHAVGSAEQENSGGVLSVLCDADGVVV